MIQRVREWTGFIITYRFLRMYYAAKVLSVPRISEKTPVFRNIYISDVFCKGAGKVTYINGFPEMPIEN